MAERSYKIAVIGGDGIGPEVVQAGQEVLTALALEDGGFALSFAAYDWGSHYYRQHYLMMPADALAQLESYDAIYFGSAGDPGLPDDITLWGLRLAICQGHINTRMSGPRGFCPA
jgi:tartrate dehydrogenase/decarboxylase / D-malate dehydrogenase